MVEPREASKVSVEAYSLKHQLAASAQRGEGLLTDSAVPNHKADNNGRSPTIRAP